MKHRQKTDQMEERAVDGSKPKHRRNMLLERIRQNKAHEKGRRQTILNIYVSIQGQDGARNRVFVGMIHPHTLTPIATVTRKTLLKI